LFPPHNPGYYTKPTPPWGRRCPKAILFGTGIAKGVFGVIFLDVVAEFFGGGPAGEVEEDHFVEPFVRFAAGPEADE